jgi:hypothetical protein
MYMQHSTRKKRNSLSKEEEEEEEKNRRETRTGLDSFFSRSHHGKIDEAQRLRATKTFDNPPQTTKGREIERKKERHILKSPGLVMCTIYKQANLLYVFQRFNNIRIERNNLIQSFE